MKKYILFFIPLLAFLACNDDDGYSLDDYWVDIVTVENPSNDANFYMTTDKGTRLWIAATNWYNYKPATGQRILADYTILNDKDSGIAYDHDVKLNNARTILTKEIVDLTTANEAMIGNDLIGINDIWVGSDYLNVRFYYGGYNKTHYINLITDERKQYADGKIHLELRHNMNGDASTYRYNGMVCFNLSSLWEDANRENQSTLDLVIHVREYDNEEKTYSLTYRINGTNTDNKSFERDDLEELEGQEIL